MLLSASVREILSAQKGSNKPLAVVLAGHNGSGKTTLWDQKLVDLLQLPLVNADRMMMSVLPAALDPGSNLPSWAAKIRDANQSWMSVARQTVEAFVGYAMELKVPVAFETVFSHHRRRSDGTIETKVDRIRELQSQGYFVVLFFVGLSNANISIGRVKTRFQQGGHDVPVNKLRKRFPLTQKAIKKAIDVADASILFDNSREEPDAFTVCRVQMGHIEKYDIRNLTVKPPEPILEWLKEVNPRPRSKDHSKWRPSRATS